MSYLLNGFCFDSNTDFVNAAVQLLNASSLQLQATTYNCGFNTCTYDAALNPTQRLVLKTAYVEPPNLVAQFWGQCSSAATCTTVSGLSGYWRTSTVQYPLISCTKPNEFVYPMTINVQLENSSAWESIVSNAVVSNADTVTISMLVVSVFAAAWGIRVLRNAL
jgi:hypothetical protein